MGGVKLYRVTVQLHPGGRRKTVKRGLAYKEAGKMFKKLYAEVRTGKLYDVRIAREVEA